MSLRFASPALLALAIACGEGDVAVPEEPDFGDCGPATRAVTAAAAESARCSEGDACAIRRVPLCSVEGLGCYWAAVNVAAPPERLDEAIRAYEQTMACGVTSCDCEMPPVSARCVAGRCTP